MAPHVEPWKKADIIYVSIVGVVMLMALLEWLLGLAAFLYCLGKAFLKAEENSTRILAIVMMVIFTAMRGIFLPVMIVTLPLPGQLTQHFPAQMVAFLQWFAFWTFAGLLTVPWLFCIYQLVTNSLGRQKRIKYNLDEDTAPKVVIVMPCYREEPEVLLKAIDSVVACDYPPACLHVFLSFDGDSVNELYLQTVESLGVPRVLEDFPQSIDVEYREARVTISKFPHGGKRKCQKKTYHLIESIYTEYLKLNDNLFILFIDSDCILDQVCIQNFVYEMELKPGNAHNMLAMTGVITSTTEKNTLITLLQDMEYIHGQLFERSVESGCGAVTCLPGALTILRFSAFRNMAKYYFADKAEQCDDMFDYGKCHLGEDRWLTHLFMIGAEHRYQIGMCTGAFCKTEAVQTYRNLLKQRRRWFLGFITNEACMLTDARLWWKYPVLCCIRLMQNTIRTTALLFLIMVLSLITTSNKVQNLPVGFIAVSLGLNWLLMFYFGLRLRRYKIWLYPLMFVVNPFFNWVYMIYGICTAGQRTWGGPRADAGMATQETSPQQAIEHAEATGDDLNIVPETFRSATDSVLKRSKSVPLQPPNRVRGRFKPAEMEPDGFYRSAMESRLGSSGGLDAADLLITPRRRYVSRDSVDSYHVGRHSVVMPRRVEALVAEEELRRPRIGRTTFDTRPSSGRSAQLEWTVPQSSRIEVQDPTIFDDGHLDLGLARVEGDHSSRVRNGGYSTDPLEETRNTSGTSCSDDLVGDSMTQSHAGSDIRFTPLAKTLHPHARSSIASKLARSPLEQMDLARGESSASESIVLEQRREQGRVEDDEGEMENMEGKSAESTVSQKGGQEKKRKKFLKRFRIS